MNKDQVKGQYKKTKGTLKEVTGEMIGDKTMENKGKVQNSAGKIQKSYGGLKEDIKNSTK